MKFKSGKHQGSFKEHAAKRQRIPSIDTDPERSSLLAFFFRFSLTVQFSKPKARH
jgi:hypothetical protein